MRRFIQDASHELHASLVTIQGYSEFTATVAWLILRRWTRPWAALKLNPSAWPDWSKTLLMLARLDEQRPMEKQSWTCWFLVRMPVEDTKVRAPDRGG